MATRRVVAKTINWAALGERVPPTQRTQFNALKAKADALKAKLGALPEKPPSVSWETYKQTVPVAGLVDKFQKEFASVKVPYPKDSATSVVDSQEKEMDQNVASYVVKSNKIIKDCEDKITELNGMIPYEDMTVEEYLEMHPEAAPDKKKYPHWPHFATWEL